MTRKIVTLCIFALLLSCENGDQAGTGSGAVLSMARLAHSWKTVESQLVVDSVVCGRQCYTATSTWETLTPAGDSSFSRLRCVSTGGQYVSQHSQDCNNVVVAQLGGSSNCVLDSGSWLVHGDSICLSLPTRTECYVALLSGDGLALSLTDSVGVVRRYALTAQAD